MSVNDFTKAFNFIMTAFGIFMLIYVISIIFAVRKNLKAIKNGMSWLKLSVMTCEIAREYKECVIAHKFYGRGDFAFIVNIDGIEYEAYVEKEIYDKHKINDKLIVLLQTCMNYENKEQLPDLTKVTVTDKKSLTEIPKEEFIQREIAPVVITKQL